MGKVKLTDKGLASLVKVCQARLEAEVDENVIPFAKFHVRVDTGRLRESIEAEPAEYKPSFRSDEDVPGRIKAVVVEVNIGGTPQFPTARIDNLGERMVDYAVELEDSTRNLSEDIFNGLPVIYI